MIWSVASINGVEIRLTEERWAHIVESHDDLASYAYAARGCVKDPDFIVKGIINEVIACKKLGGKYLIAVYKESNNADRFVITAYMTGSVERLLNRGILWRRK